MLSIRFTVATRLRMHITLLEESNSTTAMTYWKSRTGPALEYIIDICLIDLLSCTFEHVCIMHSFESNTTAHHSSE
jgi:hypothetical protein